MVDSLDIVNTLKELKSEIEALPDYKKIVIEEVPSYLESVNAGSTNGDITFKSDEYRNKSSVY